MAEYTTEQLKGLQRVSLEMAEYLVGICKENELLCYFCGGGCIGALRHKGFIPWDDDLDFFMPREDYEKLVSIWDKVNTKSYYVMEKSKKNHVDRNLFLTIRDTRTTQIKPYQQDLDLCHGIALDVIPIDGYPSNEKDRKRQCIWALVFSLFCAQTVPTKHGRIMAICSKIALCLISVKSWRYRIWKMAEKKMTRYPISQCEYITELCSGPFYMKKKYRAEWFKEAKWVEFEQTSMPIPIGCEEYLKEAFGDYMQLPPIDKQKAHHDSILLDFENGYEKYRGTYFCKKKGKRL